MNLIFKLTLVLLALVFAGDPDTESQQLVREQTRMRYKLERAQDNMLYVVVTDTAGEPMPGVTMYLVSVREGRSAPQITDDSGLIVFQGFPVGMLGTDYVIEAYAGTTLVRQWMAKLKKGPNKITVTY